MKRLRCCGDGYYVRVAQGGFSLLPFSSAFLAFMFEDSSVDKRTEEACLVKSK